MLKARAEDFLLSQLIFRIEETLRPHHPYYHFALGKFLLDGPPVQRIGEDPLCTPYSHAVRRLLLDQESRSWLMKDVSIFFDKTDWVRTVERDEPGIPRMDIEHGDLETNQQDPAENVFDEEEIENIPWQSSISWHQIRQFLSDRLLPPLATAICILNITTALGYVFLMNDLAPPNLSYVAS